MENKSSSESIKEIVDIINEKAAEPIEDTEFEFGEKKKSTGLVFESVPVEDFKKKEKKEKLNFPPEDDEFSVPDVFEVSEKYNTPATEDAQSHIRTTYVPRFTEASEKYRMVNDPRYKKSSDGQTKIEAHGIDPEQNTATGELDPTAELEREIADAVIVRTAPPKEEDTESLSIFKFEPDEDELDEDEVAKEREEIASLIGKEIAKEPEPAPVEEVEEPVAEEEPVEEPERNLTIPDPEPSELSVVDYGAQTKTECELAPDGASDLPADAVKNHSEFTHTTQRDGFKDKFLDKLMSVKIRLFAAAFFAILLLAYETLISFDILGGMIETNYPPAIMGVLDLLLVGCLFALTIPELAGAVKRMTDGQLTADMLILPTFIAIGGYTLLIALTPTASEFMLFGFVFALLAFAVILASYLRTSGDFAAFKIISKNSEKKIVDRKLTRELPEENLALDGLVEEYKSRTARIFRAGFITDFFSRIAKSAENGAHVLKILSITAGSALVAGIVCFFIGDGIISALCAFALVMLLGCPALTLISHKLIYSGAQRALHAEDSTVIGAASYDDYAQIDVVAFEDTEIFGTDDVNLKRFMLYGDSDSMEKAMQQMCSLFNVAGGPLKYIFENSLDRRVRHIPATDTLIEDDGISGNVAGKCIRAGTSEYMARYGIAIPDAAAKSESGIDTTKIMYAAEDGEVYAKFYIRYSFSEEFTSMLPTMKEEGIIPVIYTRDPNVSNELLRILSAGSDCMRVVKKHTPCGSEVETMYRSVSAGAVTYGDKLNAINLILLAKRYKKLNDRIRGIEIYSMAAGIGLAVLISVLKMLTVPSFIFGLWQLAWCIVVAVSAATVFRKDKN